MTTYLLDANVFIQAKNREYGFDFCPGFWEWIDVAHAAGTVFSVDAVRDELINGQDDLSEWAQERGPEFFLEPDEAALISMQALSEWTIDESAVLPAGYTVVEVRAFKDGLAERMAMAAHPASGG